jgi:hypothetical protein
MRREHSLTASGIVLLPGRAMKSSPSFLGTLPAIVANSGGKLSCTVRQGETDVRFRRAG